MKYKIISLLVASASAFIGAAQSNAVLSSEEQGLSLAECQRMALENNRTLQNARLDIEIAAADRAAAFSHYFPQVSVGLTGFIGAKDLMRSEMDMSGFGATYGPALVQAGLGDLLAGLPPTNKVSMVKKGVVANAVALQPIFSGGQIMNGNKLAVLQNEVRRLQYAMTEKDILQNVADYYWQIIALRGNISTLDAVDAQLSGIHSLTENYVKSGIINRNDLLTVELKQQEMASARLQLNNGLELLRLVLCQLCGGELDSFAVAAAATDVLPAPSELFVSPADAVHNREELALAEKNVEAKTLQVKMERGKNLPSLAVGAAGLFQGIDMGDMSTKRGGSMYDMKIGNLVGLATLSVPVSDWWGGRQNIRKARFAREQAENDRLDAEEKLQIDILSSWNNLTEAYAQIQIAEKSIAASTENLRLTRDQYAAGTLPVSDLLDAVSLYSRANNDLNAARATYQSRMSEYVRKTR